jgi:Spy/CpxP family protein refolding chaperone
MKKVRQFIIGGAILTMAAGAVVTSPPAIFAQNEAKEKVHQRRGMHRVPGAHAPLISIALKHRAELNLSGDQVAGLEKIRTQFQDQTTPVQQQLRTVEDEIAALLQQNPANLIDARVKIEQAEKLRSELRYLRVEALENGKSLLTAQQRDQLKTLAGSGPRGFRKPQGQQS